MGWRFGQQYAGGHLAGQMVMHCIANRVRCGWGSWLEVISRIPLFMAENEMPPLDFPSVWNGAFVKLLHAVDGIYDGAATDLTKGALYWGDLNHIERQWFKERVMGDHDAHPRVADMNALSFWR